MPKMASSTIPIAIWRAPLITSLATLLLGLANAPLQAMAAAPSLPLHEKIQLMPLATSLTTALYVPHIQHQLCQSNF